MTRSIDNLRNTDKSGHRQYTCTLLGYMSMSLLYVFRLIHMDEDKPKKKRKKAVAADDGAGEHKRPWQENLATMAEIKAFVSDRYYLRYNVVRRGVECRRPSSYDHDGTGWELISDRIVNSLRVELSATKSVRKQDIWDLIESDFTPEFHPFLYYLDHLPPWDGQDYIMELSVSVSVAGGSIRWR